MRRRWLVPIAAVACVPTLAGCILFEPFPDPASEPTELAHDAGGGGGAGHIAADAGAEAAAGGSGGSTADAGPCGACAGECLLGQCVVPVARMPDSSHEAPSDGAMAIPCPDPGTTGYGQDCNYRIHVPTYLTDDLVAVDVLTGLVWQRKCENEAIDRDAAQAHCAALGAEGFGGFDDWRLPTARELSTIIDTGKTAPGLDPDVFDGHGYGAAWTTDPQTSLTSSYWIFATKYSQMSSKFDYEAWPGTHCVRGPALESSSFTLSASGEAVLDAGTGLVWQRAVSTVDQTWLEALAYCESLDLEGATDWRLPSYKELWTLVDISTSQPAIDPTFFPDTPLAAMWSSTPDQYFRNLAKTIDFTFGEVGAPAGLPMDGLHRSRCVRGGGP